MEANALDRISFAGQGQFLSARDFILSTSEQSYRLKLFKGNTKLISQQPALNRNTVVCNCGNFDSHISSAKKGCRLFGGQDVGTWGVRSSRHRIQRPNRVRARKADAAKEEPPTSREEALQQARTSLALLLEKALQKQNKKSNNRGAKGPRLTVELPVLDTSPSSTVKLTRDVFQGLVSYKIRDLDVAVFYGDRETATLAEGASAEGPRGWLMHALDESTAVPDRTSLIVLAGVRENQLPAVDRIVNAAGSRPIVALNPEWYPEGAFEEASAAPKTVADSFDVCYSYLPLKIQGFFGTSEGAVLKYVTSGAPGGAPWLVFVKEKKELKVSIKLQKRPNAGDLEQAFYIKSAAESPVAKSVNFVRGLASMISGK